MAVLWNVVPCSLVEVVRRFTGTYCLQQKGHHVGGEFSSETSVNFNQTTRRNILEDSHLYTRRQKNLKFQLQPCCMNKEEYK